jgi:8-oxo-dGTP diphosphatase
VTPAAPASPLPWPSYPHEVLAVVLSVREGTLCALLWRREREPFGGAWALPGGSVAADERLRTAITRHLAQKVDVRELAHLEQLATHSAVDRDPRGRVLATGYLGVVPADVSPALPADTRWHPVDALPDTAFDHRYFITTSSPPGWSGCGPSSPTPISASRSPRNGSP